MNQELETLLKAWDAYVVQEKAADAERLFIFYESKLEEVCGRTRVGKEIMHRAVKRAYQRWQWLMIPSFRDSLER